MRTLETVDPSEWQPVLERQAHNTARIRRLADKSINFFNEAMGMDNSSDLESRLSSREAIENRRRFPVEKVEKHTFPDGTVAHRIIRARRTRQKP